MIIYIDGPTASRVGEFAKLVVEAFEPRYNTVVVGSGEETFHPVMRPFLDSPQILVIVHGWAQEYVHERLRGSRPDWFLNEWLYTRPILGRGGRYITTNTIIPYRYEKSEFDMEEESIEFTRYAMTCRYPIIQLAGSAGPVSDDAIERVPWEEHAVPVRKSALTNIHTVGSYHYVGPQNPRVTFVGDWEYGLYDIDTMPFVDELSVQYFRQLGAAAIYDFGYARIETFRRLPARLRRKIVTVGTRAHRLYPQYPNVLDVNIEATPGRLQEFYTLARIALAQYKETNHDHNRARRAREGRQDNVGQRNGTRPTLTRI